MIDLASYQTLCSANPALNTLSERVADILRDELTPSEEVRGAWVMKVGKTPGALVLTNRRLIAVWTMKLFFFFSFPTIQEFDLEQLRRCEARPSGLYLRASATESDDEEDYEENAFDLEPAAADELTQLLQGACPAL